MIGDSIQEYYDSLPEGKKDIVTRLFEISRSIRYTLSDKNRAADKALLILGAKRSGKGYSKLYNMPCGCVYTLDFARPYDLHHCKRHPEQTVKEILKNFIHGK